MRFDYPPPDMSILVTKEEDQGNRAALETRIGKLEAQPVAQTTTIGLGLFTVTNGVLTVTAGSLHGIASVTRLAVGRYRCTFAAAQLDLLYVPRGDIRDTEFKVLHFGARTLTNFEIMVKTVSLLTGLLGTPAVDAAEVFFSVERKV